MLWTDVALKVDGADVVDLRPAWLPVDRALVQLVVPSRRRVDRINVDHWHWLIEHLWGEQNIAGGQSQKSFTYLGSCLNQLASLLIKTGTLKEEAMDENPLVGVFQQQKHIFL